MSVDPKRQSAERRQRRICMVSYSFYESDNRIIRYAESLAARGDHVEVFALRRAPELAKSETVNGVEVRRLQDRFGKNEGGPFGYLRPILRFALGAAGRIAMGGPYDLVHVHNIPDFLIFSALPAKFRGAALILDVHDIGPEFFACKFEKEERSLFVRALKVMERVSAGAADHVILANHLWLERYVARSAPAEKCSVFINHVDENIFQRAPRKSDPQTSVIIYPGGLQWHQGLDIAIRAFGALRAKLPEVQFHIYGDGGYKGQLVALVEELGLTEAVRFFEPLSLREIARVVGTADLGVVPKRANSFGNEAYSTKIMEFMALGVPVVVSATRVDRYYFDDSVVRFFPSGDLDALADAMHELLTDPVVREALVRNASDYVRRNSWDQRKNEYFELVDRLIARRALS